MGGFAAHPIFRNSTTILIQASKMKAQFFLAPLLASVHATKVLLPLYVYPSTWETPNPWQYIYDTIASHPNITFQVILNVDSGPGSSAPGHSKEWTSEVPKLNAYPNVHTYGYVPTLYGTRTLPKVVSDITAWANWNTYTAANLSVNGIFFDQVPNDGGSTAQKKDLALMSLLTSVAKTTFNTTKSFEVVFNPGTKVEAALSSSYFQMADYVVVYEQYAVNYTADNPLGNGYVPAGMASKSSILLHDVAKANLPASTVQSWLKSFVQAGLGATNVLTYGYEQCNSTAGPASLGNVSTIISVGH